METDDYDSMDELHGESKGNRSTEVICLDSNDELECSSRSSNESPVFICEKPSVRGVSKATSSRQWQSEENLQGAQQQRLKAESNTSEQDLDKYEQARLRARAEAQQERLRSSLEKQLSEKAKEEIRSRKQEAAQPRLLKGFERELKEDRCEMQSKSDIDCSGNNAVEQRNPITSGNTPSGHGCQSISRPKQWQSEGNLQKTQLFAHTLEQQQIMATQLQKEQESERHEETHFRARAEAEAQRLKLLFDKEVNEQARVEARMKAKQETAQAQLFNQFHTEVNQNRNEMLGQSSAMAQQQIMTTQFQKEQELERHNEARLRVRAEAEAQRLKMLFDKEVNEQAREQARMEAKQEAAQARLVKEFQSEVNQDQNEMLDQSNACQPITKEVFHKKVRKQENETQKMHDLTVAEPSKIKGEKLHVLNDEAYQSILAPLQHQRGQQYPANVQCQMSVREPNVETSRQSEIDKIARHLQDSAEHYNRGLSHTVQSAISHRQSQYQPHNMSFPYAEWQPTQKLEDAQANPLIDHLQHLQPMRYQNQGQHEQLLNPQIIHQLVDMEAVQKSQPLVQSRTEEFPLNLQQRPLPGHQSMQQQGRSMIFPENFNVPKGPLSVQPPQPGVYQVADTDAFRTKFVKKSKIQPASTHVRNITELEDDPAPNLGLCVVCLEHPRQTIFLDCGHIVCCKECAKLLTECPTCRNKIRKVQKAFLP